MVAVDTEEALTMTLTTPADAGDGRVCEAVEPDRYDTPESANVEVAVDDSIGRRVPGVPTT
jgi:hypothetical protein